MMRPTPEMYLHGQRGARTIIVPGRVAAFLYAQTNLQAVRPKVTGRDDEIDAVLMALALAALEGSEVGTKSAPRSELAVQSIQRAAVSTSWIAARANCSTRAVTKAIGDGRLEADRDDTNRWRIPIDEARRFVAESKKEAA